MSESLRDSAINYFNEALDLMQKGQHKEALKALEKAEEAAGQAEAYDIFFYIQALKGHLMQAIGAYEEALNIHSLTIKAAEELLIKDLDNELYQSILQMSLDGIITLGNLFYNIGRFLQAKNCYESHLLISQKLLATDPENVSYQSDVAMTLNNLGNLLSDMGRIEEAKQRYEKALAIYTEPMQYLTIGRK
jgi:tetratricopeptide (TPR) repeat protein